MYYSLQDFLNDHEALHLELLTHPVLFSQVRIDSVSVQELPLDNFVLKNELVFSTAIGCCAEIKRFYELIAGVKAAQAAALILTFKDPSYVIPDQVITYADSLNLPLFTIPWEYRFAEIQSDVIRRIQDKQLEIYQNLQTSLLNLYFDSQSLDQAAELVSGFAGYPVVIEDNHHHIRGKSQAFPKGSIEEMQSFEILINQSLAGYLRIAAPDTVFNGERPLLEKYILFPLSLWFNRKNIEDMVETRLKNDFVWNLVNQNYTSFDEIARQGMLLHFDLSKPYTCIMLKALNTQEADQVQEYSGEAVAMASKLTAIVLEQGRKQDLRVMMADRSLQFIIFVENPAFEPRPAIQAFLKAVQQQVHTAFPPYEFFWGISETSLKPPDFSALYHHATMALQYSLNSQTKEYQFTYQDTQKARILSLLLNNEEIVAMAKEALAPLQQYDALSDIDLMGTLTQYIECNYHISSTARALHIHRQSLLYRLRKIESLTEMSLTNHKDLFLLEVYSRIYSDY